MSRVLKVEISQTVEELKTLLNLTENQKIKERIQMLYWLKSEQIKSENAIANLTGKHRTTISRWLRTYRRGGLHGLLAKGKSSGRSKKLNSEIEQSLKQELRDEEGFSSYKEIQNLQVRYWCQDETRIGLITLWARKLTSQGIQPVGTEQWCFDYLWLYGLVEPRTGESCLVHVRAAVKLRLGRIRFLPNFLMSMEFVFNNTSIGLPKPIQSNYI